MDLSQLIAKEIYDDIPLDVWKKVLNENMDYSFQYEGMNDPCFFDVKTVLEIGCGTGKLINIMAKKIDKGIISGIDFSSTMVTIAKRRNKQVIIYFFKYIASKKSD